MNKITFCTLLECALLNFDGVIEEELIKKYGIDTKLAKAGIKLCEYLKSINFIENFKK